MKQFDVIVVGGGHAGCEAADAAARLGVKVALVTMRVSDLGVMSCNPAIGGLGKGHLVREIDAMGGLMARAADAAGIQFRLLNRSKGPAVQGPRAQADRRLYAQAIQSSIKSRSALKVIEGEVADVVTDGGAVSGVRLADGSSLGARSVVLTTGTFLGGVIHIGKERIPAGRVGAAASVSLSDRLRGMGLVTGRLKTGTPPRLRRSTIDWSKVDLQPGDDDPVFFSFLTTQVAGPQVDCGITETNSRTHEIISENLTESAVYGGEIAGRGPRYCPSIEDKVVRFQDKTSHQIFLEPEGLESDLVYPNGISTSLPAAVQDSYVRSIVGLEAVEIVQPGYAIEYDYADPRNLSATLEVTQQPGLFFAGQINGTTGYEEAAAQGLVAGLSAASKCLGREVPVFSRSESYIGVMLDDLIVRGVTEPYRMFTSRAEFRLSLRADNADQRLTPFARELGLVEDERWISFCKKLESLESVRQRLDSVSVPASDLARVTGSVRSEGPARTALECLEIPSVTWAEVESIVGDFDAPVETKDQIKREAQYTRYIERQKADVAQLKRDENTAIPSDVDYTKIAGLSSELTEKLKAVKPKTLSQASRMEGMTPSALLILLSHLRKRSRAAG